MAAMKRLEELFVMVIFITITELRILGYLALVWTGLITAVVSKNPWLLFITFYLAPVWRFGSFKSFSLGAFDGTLNTEDGGLHMAGGTLFYLISSPVVIYMTYIGKMQEEKNQDTTAESE